MSARCRQDPPGFSMIDLMVGLAIVVTLAVVAVPGMAQRADDSRWLGARPSLPTHSRVQDACFPGGGRDGSWLGEIGSKAGDAGDRGGEPI